MTEEPVPEQSQNMADKPRAVTVDGPIPRPSGPIRADHEAGELLREMRNGERY